MNNLKIYVVFSLLAIGLSSCQEPYTPTTSDLEQQYVIEGFIESGANSNPTYVLVTKSIPFLSKVESDKFSELFIKGAIVSVNDGQKTVDFTEICLDQVPDVIKLEVYRLLGFNPDSVKVDICIYADLQNQLNRREGGKYDLTVKIGEKLLTSTTTIPKFVGLTDFIFKPTPGIPSDTLSQLYCRINDPAESAEFYRYLTSTEGDGYVAPFTSSTDDALFSGKDFEFPIAKAERRGGGFDPETFGYFKKGDTIAIKWCTIDKAHFEFWKTRDFAANNGGPFASYTRIMTNINGGLGIWGGYAVEQYKMVVPK